MGTVAARPSAAVGAADLPEQFALADDEDYDRVAAVRWREENGLAVAANQRPRPATHRFVQEAPAGQAVFHRNRDTLDNRRENPLLLCLVAPARSACRPSPTACWPWDRRRTAPAPPPGRIAAGTGRGLRRVRFRP